MRDRKFRAWDNKIKEFRYSDLWCVTINDGEAYSFGGESNKHSDFFDWPCERKELGIEDFTGLKDINEKEIYEGDIVKVYDNLSGIGANNYKIYQVIWNTTQPSLIMFNENLEHEYLTIWNEYCDLYEIIGNIHETPELIK